MSEASVPAMEDDGEGFAEGDVPLSSLDPASLDALQSAITAANTLEDEHARSLAAVELLSGLYGDDLEVH